MCCHKEGEKSYVHVVYRGRIIIFLKELSLSEAPLFNSPATISSYHFLTTACSCSLKVIIIMFCVVMTCQLINFVLSWHPVL